MVTAYLLKDYRDIWLGLRLRKTRVRKREKSPSGYRVCERINTITVLTLVRDHTVYTIMIMFLLELKTTYCTIFYDWMILCVVIYSKNYHITKLCITFSMFLFNDVFANKSRVQGHRSDHSRFATHISKPTRVTNTWSLLTWRISKKRTMLIQFNDDAPWDRIQETNVAK